MLSGEAGLSLKTIFCVCKNCKLEMLTLQDSFIGKSPIHGGGPFAHTFCSLLCKLKKKREEGDGAAGREWCGKKASKPPSSFINDDDRAQLHDGA